MNDLLYNNNNVDSFFWNYGFQNMFIYHLVVASKYDAYLKEY